MLRLKKADLTQIKQIARQAYPHECCGILLGSTSADVKMVGRLVEAENQRSDSPANRYLIEPQLLIRVEKEIRGTGEEIVGFFHSHPDVPARPSAYDRDHAWPWYSYLIVSVIEKKVEEVLSWRLKENRTAFDTEVVEFV